MGCITSKTSFINDNPNRFDVIYADTENECRYWRSQLEITGNSLAHTEQIQHRPISNHFTCFRNDIFMFFDHI